MKDNLKINSDAGAAEAERSSAEQIRAFPAERTEEAGLLRRCEGTIRLLERRNNLLFPVELWLLNDQVNRNGWRFTQLEQNMRQFIGTPILIAYPHGGATIGDGHNFRDEIGPDGKPAPSFTGPNAERIVGAIFEKSDAVRLEQRDGATWVVARGALWAFYAKELVQKIEQDAGQGRAMSISIEALVSKEHSEGDVDVEDEYEILGTTILGDHVAPAVADARILALAKKDGTFRELKMRAAAYEGTDTAEAGGRVMLAPTGTDRRKMGQQDERMIALSIYSKTQRDALQAKFPKGWRVLEAADGENGSVNVALCNDAHEFACCELKNPADAVSLSMIKVCAARMDLGIGVGVDVSALMAEQDTEIQRLSAALDAANNALADRDAQIKARDTAENLRRVNAAKEIAQRTLAAFNANRGEKIGSEVLSDTLAAIEAGSFTAQVDGNGQWCGDKAVENAVYAACARKVQEQDEHLAAKSRKTCSFDKILSEGSKDDGISGLLSRKGVI